MEADQLLVCPHRKDQEEGAEGSGVQGSRGFWWVMDPKFTGLTEAALGPQYVCVCWGMFLSTALSAADPLGRVKIWCPFCWGRLLDGLIP